MNKKLITTLTATFEEHAHHQDGVEFWFARDLQILLEYKRWDKFLNVIEKAQIACKNADSEISDHFSHVGKTIAMPKGATKEIDDFMLAI
ncbi:MAG: hypothetical protein MUE85_10415 [Microscillaceae bacterium]|jgi:DNA-damage-inducible protein D|nr:hypothetical protein [Microscillaceae bacterium]